jgi:hypothetical protein
VAERALQLLASPGFWLLVGVGVLGSFLFTLHQLRGGRAGRPLALAFGVAVAGSLVVAFVLFGWGGCGVAVLISLLGWSLTPLAARLALRR